ncbi:lysozyme inhibitor LprI family protein [Paracoccus shanxieyensis]|uniref:DUF1311 domain-containing protein n=1 Tax=Paracoccus shanxieyensis TaxID=2675752 RepID=A0A6L6IX89_9RHOB|nr:lysozyme inhibitor LprI family protein [Paracoccus shanxieyensis]MTH65135.1 DUF1311 domain-containing protein [Paracoccus shanxieyensis]MTH88279.1 DUF1311 domain-containing protein [Paracoccus shanxieyensis]
MKAALLALLIAPPAFAGDSSGFDPAAIDQCLEAAQTQGARADCADAGMQACLDYATARYTGDDADFPMANCLDAAHQAWEAKLTATYADAVAQLPAQPLRAAERDWIAFRAALCAVPTGDLAKARCIRDETARQTALLISMEPS